MTLIKYPIIFVSFVFITGITLSDWFASDVINILYVLSILLIASLIIKLKYSILFSQLFFYLLIFFSSVYYADRTKKGITDFDYSEIINQDVRLYGQVGELLKYSESKVSFIIETDSLFINGKKILIEKNCLVNVLNQGKINLKHYFNNILRLSNTFEIDGKIQPADGFSSIFEFKSDYFKSKGISFILNTNLTKRVNLIKKNNSYINFIDDIRIKFLIMVNENLPADIGYLINSLITGDRSEIPIDVNQQFVNSGTIHILAVSGSHVGIILILLMFALQRSNKFFRFFTILIALIFYWHFTGATSSAKRAIIMAIVWQICLLLERKNNNINVLAISALILLFINPLELYQLGFQLSFAAVLSIIIFYPMLEKQKQNILKKIKRKNWKYIILDYLFESFLITIAAQILLFPILAYYFERFSIISFLSNLIIVPLSGIIITSSFVMTLFYFLSAPLFFIFREANIVLVKLLIYFVEFFGNIRHGNLILNNYNIFNALIYFISIILIVYFSLKIKRFKIKFILIILVIGDFLIYSNLVTDNSFRDKKYLYVKNNSLINVQYLVNRESVLSLKLKMSTDKLEVYKKEYDKIVMILLKLDSNDYIKLHIDSQSDALKELLLKRLKTIDKTLILVKEPVLNNAYSEKLEGVKEVLLEFDKSNFKLLY